MYSLRGFVACGWQAVLWPGFALLLHAALTVLAGVAGARGGWWTVAVAALLQMVLAFSLWPGAYMRGVLFGFREHRQVTEGGRDA